MSTTDPSVPSPATTGHRARRWGAPLLLAVLMASGWTFVWAMNRWHVTAPTVILMLCWAALVVAGYWTLRMAVASRQDDDARWFESRGRRDPLEREKKSLLKAIKEIEFDRETSKISEADAAELVAGYRAKAIEVIKALEQLEASGDARSTADVIAADLRARAAVERSLAKSRRASATKPEKPS